MSAASGSTNSSERATVDNETPLQSVTRKPRTATIAFAIVASCARCSTASAFQSVSVTVLLVSSTSTTSRL